MQKKPRILITNDDGIEAPGIYSLWKSLKDHCQVSIIAPATEKSGVGLCITLREPLHIQEVKWEENTPAWKINGTPADCVRLGMNVLLKNPPDLIVSGINKGANSGRTVLYSGTVAGVIEGTMQNVPGIAFSCHNFVNPDYSLCEEYIYPFVQYLLDHPLPKGSFLNVNFPDEPKERIKGCKLAKQGMSYFKEDPAKRVHPEGHEYYWLGGKWEQAEDEHEESDVHLLNEGYITAVPLQIHQLTDHHIFQTRKEHFSSLFS